MREQLKFILTISSLVLGLVSTSAVWANNLSVSSVSLTSADSANDTVKVQFNISWDNSWRTNTNRDAVWVFIKYSTDSGSSWGHAVLKTAGTNPSGFSAGTGTALNIIVSSDKRGAFLERSAAGVGSVSTTSVQLVWDYGANSLTDATTARVKVFAIEMVYIPTGNFYVGDGNGSSESTYALHVTNNTAQLISTDTVSLTSDSNADDDIDTSPIAVTGGTGIAGNASWPNGYSAFYLMKYEITEAQWVDFFNTLTNAQKANRDITDSDGKNADTQVERNTVSWVAGNASTTTSNRVCGFLSWMDVCAYADWAALRPMTELEYEKACRGPQPPVVGEYPWGSSSIQAIAGTYLPENIEGYEIVDPNGSDNANYDSTVINDGSFSPEKGPIRAGLFGNTTSVRYRAAAGYYGNMELAGNVVERVVTIGNAVGRSFQGTHGDGVLTSVATYEGNATNADWPGIDGTPARGVTGASGSGQKGGGYDDNSSLLIVSDRQIAATANTSRTGEYGGRLVRTA